MVIFIYRFFFKIFTTITAKRYSFFCVNQKQVTVNVSSIIFLSRYNKTSPARCCFYIECIMLSYLFTYWKPNVEENKNDYIAVQKYKIYTLKEQLKNI